MAETTDPTPTVNTYHCICTTLTLSTVYNLDDLPTRTGTKDKAIIIPISTHGGGVQQEQQYSGLHGVSTDSRPTVIRRTDGFEKRRLIKCTRCLLTIGYQLDGHQPEGSTQDDIDVCYVLPGSLVTTEQMKAGKAPRVPDWARATT